MRTLVCSSLALGLAACAQAPVAPTTIQVSATATIGAEQGTLGVSPTKALFLPGETTVFSAIPRQISTNRTADVTWSVDNPQVATVDAAGRLTAVASGFTWLRARGDEGDTAHPINVSAIAPRTIEGWYWLDSCESVFVMTCSSTMKTARNYHPVSMRYLAGPFAVVAEVWLGTERNIAAMVGTATASNEFRFTRPSFLTPQLALGGGGCCITLSDFTVGVGGPTLTHGGFTETSNNSTVRTRIVTR